MVQEGAGEKEVLLQSHSFPSFSYFCSQWSTSIPTQCQVDFQGLLVQQVEMDQIFLPVHSFPFFSYLSSLQMYQPTHRQPHLRELVVPGEGGENVLLPQHSFPSSYLWSTRIPNH